MDTAERVRCKCGLPMEPLRQGAVYCKNCDVPHALKTKYDIHYEMYWKRYIEENMPPKQGGTDPGPNPDDSKE